ncbi:hypothetical protein FA95DRAFT_1573076 [Auriscalpium vulgare]|uniref:Uncharacterized protein n=1 Tax=Auriscalpium vulgare TaxID=40419 RepID=A0ACB8RRK8_9AGAM|nr:hypothetical protein FA95DRAFT_1573076 [Auriscalpium vulgare]
MGSASSNISSEAILTAVVVAGAITYGYFQYTRPSSAPAQTPSGPGKKKGKKGKHVADVPQADVAFAPPTVVRFPHVIPGEFEASIDKSKKSKKKKGKKAAAGSASDAVKEGGEQQEQGEQSDASVGPAPTPTPAKAKAASKAKRQAATQLDPTPAEAQEERWTRVESRKKQPPAATGGESSADGKKAKPKPTLSTADLATSDAGITTSVTTGNSSPATEKTTEDELPASGGDESAPEASTSERPSAPQVIRIQPGEKPAKGFTWEDYEGVQVGEDADGEDDGGWGVVKSKRSSRLNQTAGGQSTPNRTSSNTPLTKKQRQNAAKREAQKLAKQDAAADQQAVLARHKRELERARMAEQFSTSKGKP